MHAVHVQEQAGTELSGWLSIREGRKRTRGHGGRVRSERGWVQTNHIQTISRNWLWTHQTERSKMTVRLQ